MESQVAICPAPLAPLPEAGRGEQDPELRSLAERGSLRLAPMRMRLLALLRTRKKNEMVLGGVNFCGLNQHICWMANDLPLRLANRGECVDWVESPCKR